MNVKKILVPLRFNINKKWKFSYLNFKKINVDLHAGIRKPSCHRCSFVNKKLVKSFSTDSEMKSELGVWKLEVFVHCSYFLSFNLTHGSLLTLAGDKIWVATTTERLSFLAVHNEGNTENEKNGYVVFNWHIYGPAGKCVEWWWGGRRYSARSNPFLQQASGKQCCGSDLDSESDPRIRATDL